MSDSFPCPNPTCLHQIPTSQITATGELKCPACGTVFRFRTESETTAAPHPPPTNAAKPKIPLAINESLPNVPTPLVAAKAVSNAASPSPAHEDHSAFSSGPIVVAGRHLRTASRRKRRPWVACVVLASVLFGLVVLGIILLPWWAELVSDGKTGSWVTYKHDDRKYNFRLSIKKTEWNEEIEARQGLRAFFAFQRSDPDGWIALAAKDFKTRNARDAEMEKEAVERLENYFKDNLEWEPKASDEGPTLSGQPVQRLIFRGKRDEVASRGECFMFSYRGIAYWFFIWAKDWETTQKIFADLHGEKNKGFVLLNERKGWNELPPEMQRFQGSKYPIALQGMKGYWEQFPPENEDENCDLYLQRRNPAQPNSPVKGVTVLILVFPTKPKANLRDALKDAEENLLKRQPASDPAPRLLPAPGQKGEHGSLRKFGNTRERVRELEVICGPLRYLAVLAVVQKGKHTYVIHCQCPWQDRQNWRGEFKQMLDTLEFKKNGPNR